MRRYLIPTLFVTLVFASSVAQAGPLQDCLDAFAVDEVEAAKVRKRIEGLSTDEIWELAATPESQRRNREAIIGRLTLLRRASEAGHLPSRYLLMVWSRGVEKIEPPVDGYILRNSPESWKMMEELAEAGFAPAQREVGMRAKDGGFFPKRDHMGKFDEAAAAESRKVFFEWMIKAAHNGSSGAWESLAMFYPLLIDDYESTPEDRVQAYAWTHLSELPVYDWQRDQWSAEMSEKKRSEAWDRLRSDEERRAATALAAKYEGELFPKRIRTDGEGGGCRLEPQFAD